MSANLVDLDPTLDPWHPSPEKKYQTLSFRCPLCGKGAVQIDIWSGQAGDVVLTTGAPPRRLWHAEQDEHKGWDSLTITPSIDASDQPHKGFDGNPCPGWHGFIALGKAVLA